jgi:hypothetical protein
MIKKTIKQIPKILLITVTIIILSGCTKQPTEKLPTKVYTQVGMWYIDKQTKVCSYKDIIADCKYIGNTIFAVNYSRHHFIPINTAVTIIDEGTDDVIAFKYNGINYAIKNKKGYTGLSERGLRKRMFSATKVDLSKFTSKERAYIKEGQIGLDMSKEAVLLSRGYPPIHRTPNLKSNIWRYWEGRFNSRNYIFENNILVQIDE